MELPYEINLMEQIAEKLEEWAKDEPDDKLLPDNKALSKIGYYVSITEPLEGLEKVLVWMQWHKPDIAKTIQNDYDKLLQLAKSTRGAKKANDILSAIAKGDRSFLNLLSARLSAKSLAEKLRHIAQMARKDLISEKSAGTGQEIKSVKKSNKKQQMLHREADIAAILDENDNVKQKEIAKQLGCSEATVSRSKVWKQHRAKPSRDQFSDHIPVKEQ